MALALNGLRFNEEEANAAADEWGFNCGPAAIAAICQIDLLELRPHLEDFETKRYTNPTMMAKILSNLRIDVQQFLRLNPELEMQRQGKKPWPRYGLARVQWEGPWTRPAVPIRVRYRYTHWIGVDARDAENVGIWDVNCLNNGSGWAALADWNGIIVPHILKTLYPRADGNWHLTHTILLDKWQLRKAGN